MKEKWETNCCSVKQEKTLCCLLCCSLCNISGEFFSHERITRPLWGGRGQTGKDKVMVWHWNPLPRSHVCTQSQMGLGAMVVWLLLSLEKHSDQMQTHNLLFFLQRTILLCPRSLMNRQPTYPFPKVTFPKLFDRWWLGGQWFQLTIISSRVCSYITNIWRMRAFACGKVIENSFSYIFEGDLSADTCREQIFDKFYHKGKFWLTLFD